MSDIGATGEFPQGKLTASDKGELGIKVFSVPGTIVFEFGATISESGWIPRQLAIWPILCGDMLIRLNVRTRNFVFRRPK